MAVGSGQDAALSVEEVRFLADLVAENIDRSDEDAFDPASRAIGELHRRGGEAAFALCRSWLDAPPPCRRVAARILGQLGYSARLFAQERFSLLAAMLANELRGAGDPAVLNDICVALGHLRDARAIPLVLPLMSHRERDVRFGVVMALLGYADADAVAGLIALSRDDDADVRDWATFGLGSQTDADTPALREALIARLRDRDGDTDQEAIFGLACRGDLRVVPRILEALAALELSGPLFEAVSALALPEFRGPLAAIPKEALVFFVSEGRQRIDLELHWREALAACGCDVGGK